MVRAVPEFLPPPPLDLDALRAGRLVQLRKTMVDHRLDVCVLTNPVSLRYAVDYRGFPLYQSHIPSTYLMVPVEGPLVLYCLLYTSPSPRDYAASRMPSSA